jgi:hypothetical protein
VRSNARTHSSSTEDSNFVNSLHDSKHSDPKTQLARRDSCISVRGQTSDSYQDMASAIS